jgi:mannitol 2-dehydrogenase
MTDPVSTPSTCTGGTDPRPLLSERSVFGDLVDDEGFVDRLRTALTRLRDDGVRASLAAHVAEAVSSPAPAGAADESMPA